MRLVSYNIEWFNSLFADDGSLIDDRTWSARYNVTKTEQIAALGVVFQALDADGIMIIEAPDTSRGRNGVAALENFAARFDLRAREAILGFQNDTQQEIMFLFDPDRMTARHDPLGLDSDPNTPRFDGVFRIDLDIDDTEDEITFSKPPLEIALTLNSGTALRLIGVHAKSKAPHGARNGDHAMRLAIANRRKQMAQCVWLRRRVDHHFDAGDTLIVLGDFNDGPGLDDYEELFGRSSVEIVLGTTLPRDRQLFDPHASTALGQKLGVRATTSRFYLRAEKRYFNALLDYVMVSPDLAARNPVWRVWHPFDDPACFSDKPLCDALLTASDHFPVSLDVDL